MRCIRCLLIGSALLAPLLLAGCAEEAERDVQPADTDTDSVLDGVSREEIEARARPMSPEQAESLGIIDSTTHLEIPAEDTVLPPPAAGMPAPVDTSP